MPEPIDGSKHAHLQRLKARLNGLRTITEADYAAAEKVRRDQAGIDSMRKQFPALAGALHDIPPHKPDSRAADELHKLHYEIQELEIEMGIQPKPAPTTYQTMDTMLQFAREMGRAQAESAEKGKGK